MESVLETIATILESGEPALKEIHLLEPFIRATRTALGEMVGSEIGVLGMVRNARHQVWGDIAGVIGLSKKESTSQLPRSDGLGSLVLKFPQKTAEALAARLFSGVRTEIDKNLIRDCMGEIANVVGGQAKAMLDETPYRFEFRLPPVVVDAQKIQLPPGLDCLTVCFTCDQGEFVLQLSLKL